MIVVVKSCEPHWHKPGKWFAQALSGGTFCSTGEADTPEEAKALALSRAINGTVKRMRWMRAWRERKPGEPWPQLS